MSICIFLNQGDDWDRDELKWVLCAGIGASLLPASVLFFFKDEKAIGASAEALAASFPQQAPQISSLVQTVMAG